LENTNTLIKTEISSCAPEGSSSPRLVIEDIFIFYVWQNLIKHLFWRGYNCNSPFKINVIEYRRGNKKKDNPEKLAT
jgi:hypothetical protein